MKKSTAKNILIQIKPSGFMDHKSYLSSVYQYLKKQDQSYTYLKFACDLGFSATNILNHIIQGRRKLSVNAGEQIARALYLPRQEKKYFLALIRYYNSKDSKNQEECFEELYAIKGRELPSSIDQENLKYFSKWYYPVIGELARLEDFQSDTNWIIQKLFFAIRPKQVEDALEVLEKIGIIRFDSLRNRHFRTELDLSTPQEVAHMATTSYHIQMLEMSQHAMNKVPGKKRLINGITLFIPEEAAEKIKQMIHKLEMEILALENEYLAQPGRAVYQVNFQLFPFAKDEKKKE
jgi:uncharacterized protein (TIGR02147 family)